MTRAILVFSLAAAINCPKPPGPPATPTPPPSPTVEATPTPSPEPTVFPTPSPAATPTPSPVPDPCAALAASTGHCEENPTTPSLFMHIVKEAQHEAEDAGVSVSGKIADEVAYLKFVSERMKHKGICAINGRQGGHTSDDELWVKLTNAESEHFDLIAGDEGARYAWIKYMVRCRGAAF